MWAKKFHEETYGKKSEGKSYTKKVWLLKVWPVARKVIKSQKFRSRKTVILNFDWENPIKISEDKKFDIKTRSEAIWTQEV